MPLRHLIVLIANAHRLLDPATPLRSKANLTGRTHRSVPTNPPCSLSGRQSQRTRATFYNPGHQTDAIDVFDAEPLETPEAFPGLHLKTSFSSGVRLRAVRQRRSMIRTRPTEVGTIQATCRTGRSTGIQTPSSLHDFLQEQPRDRPGANCFFLEDPKSPATCDKWWS